MKAYYSTAYGGSESSVYGDLPDPSPGVYQVLVDVKAVSINQIDWKIRRGDVRFISGWKFPRIFGSDFAGIVREIGKEVAQFKPGDRVYGTRSILFNRHGALAQLRVVDQKCVRAIPDGMSFEEAAALPIAALTALNGLRKCGVKAGSDVLINGGTGGVGHFAIQIAKASGAKVTATCSASNRDLALSFGADEVMGYSPAELAATNKKFDAVMDAYGKMKLEHVCHLLKRGGTYASTLFIPPPYLSIILIRLAFGKKLTSANMRGHPEDWKEMERLLAEGSLKPWIENIFPLERASDAFDLAEKGKPRGKIIVSVPEV
ncbi:MAG: NAD(P)-dependent alcohol dehydrogenase [Bacteroidales bacterium]